MSDWPASHDPHSNRFTDQKVRRKKYTLWNISTLLRHQHSVEKTCVLVGNISIPTKPRLYSVDLLHDCWWRCSSELFQMLYVVFVSIFGRIFWDWWRPREGETFLDKTTIFPFLSGCDKFFLFWIEEKIWSQKHCQWSRQEHTKLGGKIILQVCNKKAATAMIHVGIRRLLLSGFAQFIFSGSARLHGLSWEKMSRNCENAWPFKKHKQTMFSEAKLVLEIFGFGRWNIFYQGARPTIWNLI